MTDKDDDVDLPTLLNMAWRQADLFGDGHAGWAFIADKWNKEQFKSVIVEAKATCLPAAIKALKNEADAIIAGNLRRAQRNIKD